MGFDFRGTFTRIIPHSLIEYALDDGRQVKVEFTQAADSVRVREVFEAESEMEGEQQRAGWQAILDNFAQHVQKKGAQGRLN